jgi:hypothetical protein
MPTRTRLTTITLCLAVAGLSILALPVPAPAQLQAEVAKRLRVEWSHVEDAAGPPRLAGHIYNDSAYRVGSVRLRIEMADASNQVQDVLAWVYVTIPARSRAYFSLRRPAGGETLRIVVESFVLIAREGTDETP